MRRFMVGLLIGIVAGWGMAWWWWRWRAQRAALVSEKVPVRIPLPELPWKGQGEIEVPREAGPAMEAPPEPAEEVSGAVPAGVEAAAEGAEALLAYCVRCRTKRPIQDPEPAETKRGQPAIRGTCPECGAKLFRFVSR